MHRLIAPHASFLAVGALMMTTTSAQRTVDHNSNVWISHLGDHRFAAHWSFHTEAHIRRANLGADAQQLLLRPAVNYHLNNDVQFTVGFSYYRNYRYGAHPIKVDNWEDHLFEQVQLTQHLGKLTVQHRFRVEERFIAQLKPVAGSSPDTYALDTYTYQSRFRYRVMCTLPFGKHEKVEAKTWFASAYDELFVNFGDSYKLDYMNQNRISGLLGYQYNKHGNVQVGYLLQTLQRPGAANGADLVEMNSTWHLVLVYNLDFCKSTVAVPSAPEAK
jgi:Protein of unknown function (DUF2490)